MKAQGIKTLGFLLGYSDAYGELAQGPDRRAGKNGGGIKIIATERFARADTAVTAQALKLVAANPDAILVVASGLAQPCRTRAWSSAATKGKDLPDAPPPRAT